MADAFVGLPYVLGDVFTKAIHLNRHVVVDVRKSTEQGNRKLVLFGVDDHIDALGDEFNVDVGSTFHRVAVEVYDAWILAMDVELTALECAGMWILVDGLVEQLQYDLGSFEQIERLQYGYVHQTIVHGGRRCDEYVVAILRCIGTGNEEGLACLFFAVQVDLIRFRFIVESAFQGVIDVGHESAFAGLGKTLTDESVEANAACAKERLVIDFPIVEELDVASSEYLQCAYGVDRDEEVACKSISTATRDDAECRTEWTSERATSFTVPSPPTATQMSTSSATASQANWAAWPDRSV